MSADQLDAQFRAYTDPERGRYILNEMGLRTEEFEKMTGIAKKKVLINMTGLKQTIANNPNTSLQETRLNSIKNLVSFTEDNWHFLNDQSKSLLSQQLTRLTNQSDNNLRQSLHSNPHL